MKDVPSFENFVRHVLCKHPASVISLVKTASGQFTLHVSGRDVSDTCFILDGSPDDIFARVVQHVFSRFREGYNLIDVQVCPVRMVFQGEPNIIRLSVMHTNGLKRRARHTIDVVPYFQRDEIFRIAVSIVT